MCREHIFYEIITMKIHQCSSIRSLFMDHVTYIYKFYKDALGKLVQY